MIALRIAAILTAPCCMAILSPVAQANTEDSELIYECSLALDLAARKGVQLPVNGARAMTHFAEVTGNDAALRRQAQQMVDASWQEYKKKNGSQELEKYVLLVAQDCADLYVERGAQPAKQEGELNGLGTLSAASLRIYTDRTGDYGAVADYLVYHYPYGKDLFEDNADGDLLGKMIVEVDASGLRKWSNEAVYAIANKFYWQYNPPATRLIFAEYQRRMRMQRQTEAEAQRWAQRAADDRAAQARQANARPVGSLGSGTSSSPARGSGVYVCTTYQGTGGGRVCKEDK